MVYNFIKVLERAEYHIREVMQADPELNREELELDALHYLCSQQLEFIAQHYAEAEK